MTDTTITFTEGNDVYQVSAPGNYILTFLGGADTLTITAGTATAAMGDGNDVATIRAAGSAVHGEAGNDRFEIYAGGTTTGGAGSDLFNLRGGSAAGIDGGANNDRVNFYGAATGFSINGGDGDDDFFGYGHALSGSLQGGAGNDYFVGFTNAAGTVNIFGGLGNDIYRANPGAPASFFEAAGEGIDSVQVARGAIYQLPTNIENISVQGFSGSTALPGVISGNSLNNSINGHANAETIYGFLGNDRLFGKGGIDSILGGDGNDYLDGGDGNDTLNAGAGNDVMNGRAGADNMTGGAGNDTYYVDHDNDTVVEQAGEGTDIVRVSVSGYELSPDVETGIVVTTAGVSFGGNDLDNLLIGNAGADSLYGGLGNDTLKGGSGADALHGGVGDDTYYLDYVDIIDGDSIIEGAGEGTDTVRYLNAGLFTMANNVEIAIVSDASYVWGNDSDNQIFGSSGDDALSGDDGNDTLIGGGGADSLVGGYGQDTLNGGAGHDYINADPGADILTGGDGEDDFIYYYSSDSYTDGADVITDFVVGEDVLDLSWMDADTGVTEDQGFTIISAFDGGFGRLTITEDAPGEWGIRGDIDGDSVADFLIIVHSSQALTASDISL